MTSGGIPLSEWSGSGATRALHETIKLQVAATDRQSKVIARLTWFMAVLAFVQTIATVVQVVPIIQSYRDKNAINQHGEIAPQLKKQKDNLPTVTHGAQPSKTKP